jgi:hypothetical protein
MPVPALLLGPKRMEALEFVSRNPGLEKAVPKRLPKNAAGLRYHNTDNAACPSLVRHFSACRSGLYESLNAARPCFAPFFFVSSRRKVAKQPLDRQVELR